MSTEKPHDDVIDFANPVSAPSGGIVAALAARDAEWRKAVKESWHGITHSEVCACAPLRKLMEEKA